MPRVLRTIGLLGLLLMLGGAAGFVVVSGRALIASWTGASAAIGFQDWGAEVVPYLVLIAVGYLAQTVSVYSFPDRWR